MRVTTINAKVYYMNIFKCVDLGITIATDDIEEFLMEIESLTAGGGGDMPHPSIGAIIRAIKASKPGSSIYVFTNAPASDSHRMNEVKTLLSEKNIKIYFSTDKNDNEKKRSVQPASHMATQKYSRTKRQSVDDTYEQLSAISGGQVLTIDTNDISELGPLVSFSAVSRNTIFRREGENLSATRQFQFSVDTLTSEVMISINAEQNLTVSVVSPEG